MSDFLITTVRDGVRTIKFNRPERRNAWLLETYSEIIKILGEDSQNDAIIATILTGEGEYYSSGQDFSPRLTETDTYEDMVVRSVALIKNFVKTLIDYPKLLVAIVNGPAVGFAVTTLALCDIVYATDHATFTTPFIDLAICPEACSSYLFPRIMGRSKASRLLFLGEKISAEEACAAGLVGEVVPHAELGALFEKVQKYGLLPLTSVRNTKRLVCEGMREALYRANECECDTLVKCFLSEEFMEALMKFANRTKSKL